MSMRALVLPGLAGLLLIVAVALASSGQRIASLVVLVVFFLLIILSVLGFRKATLQLLLEMDAEDKAREAALKEREAKKERARRPRKKGE